MDRFPSSLSELGQLAKQAIREGLVVLFEDGECTQRLALTPLSAEILGVRLDRNSLRWLPAGCPEPIERRSLKYMREMTILSDTYADGNPVYDFADGGAREPAEIVGVSEQISRFDRDLRRARIGDTDARPPRIRHVLNLDRPWPIVGDCCQGIDLKWGEYCGWCDRSAEDHLIPSPGPIRDRANRILGG